MDKFPWSARYKTGIPEVDGQHQTFVYMLNSLGEYIDSNHVASIQVVVAPMLLSYIETHFAFEERLMLETQYPGLMGHVEQHRDLAAQAKAIICSQMGVIEMGTRLHQLVFSWFVEHLVGQDGRYSRYIREHPEMLKLRTGWYRKDDTVSGSGAAAG